MIDISDIKASIQSKALIQDEFFRDALFLKDSRGRLISYTGGYTVVIPCVVDGEKWAFRCWHFPIEDAKKRYALIGGAIHDTQLPCFCSFEYTERGLLVNGESLPITRMRWVEGKNLKKYICAHNSESGRIRDLASSFREMAVSLHRNHIAHGDLQHGNIIVSDSGQLFLVDYDSMFVPSMGAGFPDFIKGLKDYQHPSRNRNKYSSEKLDYFSELVIYLSLLAISEKPSLFGKYNVEDSEALLFKVTDYGDLRSSEVYRDLSGLSDTVRRYLCILEAYLKENDINALYPFTSETAISLSKWYYNRLENEDDNDWSSALRTNFKSGYLAYLRKHPNGKHVIECRAWLSTLEDKEDWNTASRTDTLSSYQLYLQKHPNGEYRNLAQIKISRLQDDTNWRAALASNTISAIENYRTWFPNGCHIGECDSIIDGLLWQEALRKNTLKSYQDYLDRYPYGNHSIDAGSAIVKLKAKERERRERERELQAWHSAEASNTISGYQGYLEEFGDNARHSEDAKRAIAELKSSEGKGWVVMLFIILICALIVWFITAQTNSDQAVPSGPQVPDSGYNPSYVDHSAEIRQIKESLDNWLPGKEAAHKNGLSVGNLSPWQKKIDKLKDYGDPSWKKYQDRIDRLK